MHWLVSELQRQTKLTVDEPTRFLRIFRECVSQRGRVGKYWSFIRVKKSVGERWVQDHNTGTQNRSYDQYADYLVHQASKLQFIDLSDYDVWFRECLADRLSRIQEVQPGMAALCLAARIGTEVKAFQDAGCFAVGIDLNPGSNNSYVLPGDFHKIQFPAESVDIVYTNSIDHAFDVPKVLSEVKRVLKRSGVFILEAPLGGVAGQSPEDYESFWWETTDDLEGLVTAAGFETASCTPTERPCVGASFVFRVVR